MNPLYLVGAGVGGIVAGFFIGWKVRGKRAEKELKAVQEFDSRQIQSLDKKLRELRNSVNVHVAEKEKKWQEIGEEIEDKNTADAIAAETKHNESQLTYRAKNEDRTNYNAITSGLRYSEQESRDERNAKSAIRDFDESGTYEITEKEYWESKEFIDEEIEFYDASGDVYKDGVLMDPDDIPLYLGYSKDELATRFLIDEPKQIYIRNQNYERIYIVYWEKGLMPE